MNFAYTNPFYCSIIFIALYDKYIHVNTSERQRIKKVFYKRLRVYSTHWSAFLPAVCHSGPLPVGFEQGPEALHRWRAFPFHPGCTQFFPERLPFV